MREIRQFTTRGNVRWALFAAAAGLVAFQVSGLAQTRAAAQPVSASWHQKDTEWASYSADVRGTRYRPLDQINASNFNQIEIAWRF